MKASNAAVASEKGGGLETVRVVTETLRLVTDKRCELYNLTEKVAEVLRSSGNSKDTCTNIDGWRPTSTS